MQKIIYFALKIKNMTLVARAGTTCKIRIFLMAAIMLTSVENYINQYKWNQDLMQNLVDDYEIVYPFQIKDNSRIGINTKNHYYANSSIHYQKCTFVVKSSYGRFKLHMEQNELLIPLMSRIKHFINETSQSIMLGKQIENCFYQGIVHGELNSKVTLSTCDGLHGALLVDNQTYFIVPMKGGDLGKRHPHMLIKAKWHQKMNCGNNGNTEWGNRLDHRMKRDVTTETKYVELAVVIDYHTLNRMENDFKRTIQFVLECINGADLIFKDALKTRVSLVYAEIWSFRSKSFFNENDDIMQTLFNFIDYSSKKFYAITKDASLFITSANFSRHEISMAANGNICSGKSAGVVQFLNRFETFRLSVEIIHNLAHIIGVRHDQDAKPLGIIEAATCDCPERNGCLMTSKTISGKRNKFATEFSSCSINDFTSVLQSGRANCLFNKPMQESALTLCGNKIVDAGEMCDCGSADECEVVDPCCDPITCTLKKGAECGAGQCCDDCKIVKSNRLCRPSVDDCDVPESCDGVSGQCPSDAYKLDGTVCGIGSDGYCYLGKCQTLIKQCQALWGSQATVAERECFEKLNMAALETGIAKTVGNAMCSFLQCRNGNDVPTLPVYSKTEFAEHSKVFECKTASTGNKSATENEGKVKDGTKCLQNRICIDGLCVHLNAIAVDPKCPSNHVAWPCSNHGVCTNMNWCHCNDGWSGSDCSIKLYDTTTKSSTRAPLTTFENVERNGSLHRPAFEASLPFTFRLETHVMLIILGVVAASILLMLLSLTLCYRRKTTRKFRSKKNSKNVPGEASLERRYSASSIDTAHRSIRFGDMPSYRHEKFQLKRKKQHERLLSRISREKDDEKSIDLSLDKTVNNSSIVVGSNQFQPPLSASAIQSSNSTGIQNPSLHRNIIDDNNTANRCCTDKSILKNNVSRQNSDLRSEIYGQAPVNDHGNARMVRKTNSGRTMDGYESEPPYPTFRVFETSARKLNECRPVAYYAHNHQDLESSQKLAIDNHQEQYYGIASNRNPNAEYSGSSAPVPRRAMPAFSVAAPRRSDDDCYLGDQSDTKNIDDSCESPTFNIVTPEPLKLDNIEYLLRELNRNPSISSSSSVENDQLVRNDSMSRSYAANRQYSNKILENRQNNDDSLLNSTPESNNLNLDEEKSSSRHSTINRRPIKLSEKEDFNTLTTAPRCVLDHRNNISINNRRIPAINQQQQQKIVINNIHYHNSQKMISLTDQQNHICAACQLPTPDLSSCDGRVSSDGSCDNNVCVCKLSSLNFKHQIA